MSGLSRYDNAIRRREGVARVGGLDEAGRGPFAGPVVAAVVVLEKGARLAGVDDSKRLTPQLREELAPRIMSAAAGFALGMADPLEIDRLNILGATHLAAARALSALAEPPGFLVTDFLKLKSPPCPVLAIVRGDSRSLAVAAASILAKVARDRIMLLLDALYPGYGFARHKGYGTAEHVAALESLGPCAAHRLSFRGVCWFDDEPAVRGPASAAGPRIIEEPRRAEEPIPPSPAEPPWTKLLSGAPPGPNPAQSDIAPWLPLRERGREERRE